jgi:hypothetical protein
VIDGICRDESRKEIARRLGFTLYKVRRIEKSAREKIAHEIEP